MPSIQIVLLYCRPGFEPECASEFAQRCADLDVAGYPRFQPDQGYVEFHLFEEALPVLQRLAFQKLIFTRQWFAALPLLQDLPVKDRITPLAEQAVYLPQASELVAETPDTTEGRELSTLARKLGSALANHLRQQGVLLPRQHTSPWRLHLFVLSGREMWLGVSPLANSSAQDRGILRLKFPAQAPSRSTLKLEEAWHQFIPRQEWDARVGGGKRAADLGAAPGGWTWQLVQQGMFVDAVDNGPMQAELMESGQVVHRREDAFLYRPDKPLDWMVCDVVDKPIKVTERMIDWALEGWCQEMIFNLKLPMKQRFKEVELCLDRLRQALKEEGKRFRLQAKHLYHDREEITCHLDLRKLDPLDKQR
ncbi:23S rRNA (cytidine(2498)-2'-O)-methyltransferase RlmM [Nitrincola tapanii]|uniref:Ribosomal RNA large subunit methyltransferase M n=1 Tax=Nitrincola tapanii TaxID=1708751 RepID=A0A5A9W6R7_9GAMM|nr:23S rRNA (cytidine(2498)-2'-O)-methyltransferase RlmM [Nitrincola tapanii]KAA0875818.1 23S rRNA (cytidine(2498)-2'-O)-methyltransferase RlmM [Nitrincola tapanii]